MHSIIRLERTTTVRECSTPEPPYLTVSAGQEPCDQNHEVDVRSIVAHWQDAAEWVSRMSAKIHSIEDNRFWTSRVRRIAEHEATGATTLQPPVRTTLSSQRRVA
jgi:hypothetical protein